MRIALICDWYSPRPGGIEAHLESLGARLAAKGHSIHVITATPGSADSGVSGVTIHRLAANRLPWADVVFQPSAVRQIGDILQRERIEVAHAHISIVAPVGIGGAYEAQRLRLPTVVTFHSFIPMTPVWAWAVGRLVRSSRWNAVFTAVSARVVREVHTFAPRTRFSILPNAVDAQFWRPSEMARSGEAIALVAIGRLRSKKRPMVLLDAMREVRRLVPEARVVLRIVGSGPFERRMRRVVEREGLEQHVEFLGWRSAGDLRSLLRESDAFLSPTVREAFGIAALEARAVGLPVVAMRESGVTDFIRDDESGLLASTDAEFIDATIRIVKDRELRDRITRHNRSTPVGFTWEQALQLHESAYAAAIAANNRLTTR